MTMRSTRGALAGAVLALVALVASPLAGVAHADPPPDTTPPTAPTNLRVVDMAFNEATLAWDASTDDSGPVQGYETEVVAPGSAQYWAVQGTSRTWTLLVQGLTYTATITALDGARNRSEPATIQFTMPVDTEAPTTPTNLHVEPPREGFPEGVLAWDASTDNSPTIIYDVWVQTPSGHAGPVCHPRSPQCSIRSIKDNLVPVPGQPYIFTVRARDVAGNMSPFSAPLTLTF
jgi:hypothetical protein